MTSIPMRTSLGICLFSLCLHCPLKAQQSIPDARYFSVIIENDNHVPARQDRHYTSGVKLSFGLTTSHEPDWLEWLGELAPLQGKPEDREFTVSLGHSMYTPEFFNSPLPQPEDRPFAGWLYGELTVVNHRPGVEEGISINLGVIGPAALGEEIQTFIHDITGDAEPRGWDNQLENEPAVLVTYRRSWFLPLTGSPSMGTDLVSRLAVNLGNVFTDIGAGLSLRTGSYLPGRDTPSLIHPALSSAATRFHPRPGRTDWMIHAGVQVRAVLHNIFLDGNLDGDSLSVSKEPLVWDFNTGLGLTFGQFKNPVYFAFSFIWRSKEFKLQRDYDSYGSATISIQY